MIVPPKSMGGYPRIFLIISRYRRIFLLGLRSLWAHRLRSLLTVLGIVFGVASVISMLAVGEGASFEAQEQIRRLGSNNIILRSTRPVETQNASRQRSYVIEYGLTYDDIERIRATFPNVEVILPNRVMRKQVWNLSRKTEADIVGTLPSATEIARIRMREGRFFSETEALQPLNVCVLEAPLADMLYPFGDALGNTMRVDGDYYRIIGIASPHETTALPNVQQRSGDVLVSRVYIPLEAARARFGETLVRRSSGSFEAERVQLHEAIVRVTHQEEVDVVAKIIEDILKAHHKKQDYRIIVPLELLREAERTKRVFNIVLGTIAAISLLVGGIGIMNIMLASITERTREIGIRRALGARRRDIVQQFLTESVLLSGTGGLLGLALGIITPQLITYFSAMPTIITMQAVALAFIVSVCVGIVFGLYPAARAAAMDPVTALRHE